MLPLIAFFAIALRSDAGAQSEQTLRVEPALVLANVAPGEKETVTLTVRADQPMKIDVTPQGMGQEPDGQFEILPADQDTSAYTGRPIVKVAPKSFNLNEGQTRQVRVTIDVPQDAGAGGRYAMLEVRGTPNEPDEEQNVGLEARIGASVVVTLEGTAQTRTGDITDVKIAPVTHGEPVNVTTVLRNTGNYHYGNSPVRMYAGATLKDPAGNNVIAMVTPLTDTSLVPTFSRSFALNLSTTEELEPGRYALEVQVGLEDGTILDRATEYLDLATPAALGDERAPERSVGGGGDNLPYLIGGSLLALVLLLAGFWFLMDRRRRATGAGGH
jgi:hypothetical protein